MPEVFFFGLSPLRECVIQVFQGVDQGTGSLDNLSHAFPKGNDPKRKSSGTKKGRDRHEHAPRPFLLPEVCFLGSFPLGNVWFKSSRALIKALVLCLHWESSHIILGVPARLAPNTKLNVRFHRYDRHARDRIKGRI